MKKSAHVVVGIIILVLLGVFLVFFKGPLSQLNPLCISKWNKIKAKMDTADPGCQTDKDCASLSCGCYGSEAMKLYNDFGKYCQPPKYSCIRPPCKCIASKCTKYFPEMETLDEVWEAAKEGLPRFLNLISVGDLNDFGFKNPNELKITTLGEPYEVYSITKENLKSYSNETRIAFILFSTNQWYFPITVNNEPRVMLTVAQSEGKWQTVDIGGTSLPQSLHTLKTRLPALLSEKGVQGEYSTKFVKIFPSNLQFVLIETTVTSNTNSATKSLPSSAIAFTREFVVVLDSPWPDIQPYTLYDPKIVMPKIVELTIGKQ